VTGVRLYWARNDGMTGHVFLGPQELFDLAREMDEQGMGGWLSLVKLLPGARVPPGQIDLALSKASRDPRTLEDGKLWHDWLTFLAGAVENGGLVVQ
jgi:hypothetical protein